MKKNKPIKGLILYNFYSASYNILLIFAMFLLIGILLIAAEKITGNLYYYSSLYPAIILVGIGLFSWTFMLSSKKDSASKWNRFQLAMPIKRSDVITSKYLGQLMMMLVGIVLTAIFTGLFFGLHLLYWKDFVRYSFSYVPLSIGIALVSCGLFYPITYTVGENREEGFSVISMLVAGGINALILWIGHTANLSQIVNAIVCVAISAVIFVVSYAIAVKIYAKKDL
ncbi:MAG: ABC-2 transporter permease [Oscillospiraceae bacterium]|nr:ABC-2 transporter permease [Oscillospiraceae bacterium]